MSGLPTIHVVGTVVADPELRFTPSGAAVCNFTVASNERRKDETGNWVDGDATFLRCNIWRQAAENVAESLSKGTRVLVSGRLKQRSYEAREGDKRTVMELEVDEVGPSLRWAVANVQKAARGSDATGQGFGQRRPTGPSNDDPWQAAPVDDQAPF